MTSMAAVTSTSPNPTERAGSGTPQARRSPTASPSRIPLMRVVAVELRKSFDTRSGFWLLAGIGLAALLTTGAVIT